MPSAPPNDLGERTFRFACDVVRFCRGLSREPGIVRNTACQLAGAATSAAANYQEAKAAYSRRDFAAKNSIVLKELRESLLWLRIVIECQVGELTEAQRLQQEANHHVSIFTAGMKRLRPL
jgi:four helix bundle protein